MNHARKKSIKLNPILLVVSALALIAAIGFTLAFMLRETDKVENTFEGAEVSCRVVEEFDSKSGVKNSIAVKNTGNISAFVRVHLVSYWKDSNGNIIGKPSVMPEFALAEDWTKTSDDTYEYKVPIAPGAETLNLLKEGTTLTLTADEDGNKQVVEIFAEAIQSDPASAKEEAWKNP